MVAIKGIAAMNRADRAWLLDRYIAEAEKVAETLNRQLLDLIEVNGNAWSERTRLADLNEKLLDLRHERAALDSEYPAIPLLMCA